MSKYGQLRIKFAKRRSNEHEFDVIVGGFLKELVTGFSAFLETPEMFSGKMDGRKGEHRYVSLAGVERVDAFRFAFSPADWDDPLEFDRTSGGFLFGMRLILEPAENACNKTCLQMPFILRPKGEAFVITIPRNERRFTVAPGDDASLTLFFAHVEQLVVDSLEAWPPSERQQQFGFVRQEAAE